MAKKKASSAPAQNGAQTKTQRKRAKREEARKEYSKQIEKAQFHREIYVLLGTAVVIILLIVGSQLIG